MRNLILGVAASTMMAGAAAAASFSPIYMSSTPGFPGTITTTYVGQAGTPDIPQFDPSLGTLTGVALTLEAIIEGDLRGESLDQAPALITLSLGALVGAEIGGLSIDDIFSETRQFNATAFDGVADFGGDSGASFLGVTGGGSTSEFFTTGLAPFVGLGFLTPEFDGVGASSGDGAGNLITQFRTTAGGKLSVQYRYEPPSSDVPVPAALPLLAAAMGGLGFMRLRRKSA